MDTETVYRSVIGYVLRVYSSQSVHETSSTIITAELNQDSNTPMCVLFLGGFKTPQMSPGCLDWNFLKIFGGKEEQQYSRSPYHHHT